MPALPDVANVLRATHVMSALGGSNDIINRYFLRYTGTAPTSSDLNSLATAQVTSWGTNQKGLFHSAYTLTAIEIVDLTTTSSAVGFAAAAVAGTRSGAVLPGGTAAVMKQHIARRYRGGHPRLYFPAGVQGDLTDLNTWGASFITAMQGDWAAYILDWNANRWSGASAVSPVNVSYFQGFTNVTFPSGRTRPVPTPRAVPVVDLITGYAMNPQVASQRRRNQQ